MMLNSPQKMESKDHALVEVFYVKKSSNLIKRDKFWAKTQEPEGKLLEMTESICCFYRCLPTCKKPAS